jgi:hypothetical protein
VQKHGDRESRWQSPAPLRYARAAMAGLLLVVSRTMLIVSFAAAGGVLLVLFWTSVEHSVTDSTATYPEIISGVERNVDYDTHLLHLGVIATSIAWTGALVAWTLSRLATWTPRSRRTHDVGFSKTNRT